MSLFEDAQGRLVRRFLCDQHTHADTHGHAEATQDTHAHTPPRGQSGRDVFFTWVEGVALRNRVLRRHVVPPGTSNASVLLCLFYHLAEVFDECVSAGACEGAGHPRAGPTPAHVRTSCEAFVPVVSFVHEAVAMFDEPCIGGSIQHLQGELRSDVAAGRVAAPPPLDAHTHTRAHTHMFVRAATFFGLAGIQPLRDLRFTNSDLATAISVAAKGRVSVCVCV
jgi:hypothetical protein